MEQTPQQFWADRKVLVTGAGGTVGGEVVRQLLKFGIDEVRGLDNDEGRCFFMSNELSSDSRYRGFFGDVTDQKQVDRLSGGTDTIIHLAALKHVPVCEWAPDGAVNTNIIGVQNIIRAARASGVERVLFTSSDKAVNPTNVMGTTKLMGERLISAVNTLNSGESDTVFFTTRFGNVIGSNGSVVPIFHEQIAKGGPITLTDSEMTRFMMPLEHAVKLILDSTLIGNGGEVFITKMPTVRIADIAKVMIRELAPRYGFSPDDIVIEEVGIRPGEKLYEELMTEEELPRSLETENNFIVLPALKNLYGCIDYIYPIESWEAGKIYNSKLETPISLDEVWKLVGPECS